MSKYQPYREDELEVILNEPWEVSDRPYMLFASFALNTLSELSHDEEEEETAEIWGSKIPKKILDRMIVDLASDFNDAAKNHKPIKINGKSYSIRRVNAFDPKRLTQIFKFNSEGGEYIISKDGVLNLAGTTSEILKPYEVTAEESKENRSYLRKIIKLAEDDDNNGWDKLTDMEIVLYCWGMFYTKYQSDNLIQFKTEYKDYLYVNDNEIKSCFNGKSTLRGRPNGLYAFSCKKVMEWNEASGQVSVTDKIPDTEAEDYWYEIALKTTFKPLG